MKVKDVLVETKKLLSDKSKWTTKTFARDADNDPVHPLRSTACKFCVLGAMKRVCPDDVDIKAFDDTVLYLRTTIVDRGLSYVNDFEGYDAVMDMLDSGIKLLEGKENGQDPLQS